MLYLPFTSAVHTSEPVTLNFSIIPSSGVVKPQGNVNQQNLPCAASLQNRTLVYDDIGRERVCCVNEFVALSSYC